MADELVRVERDGDVALVTLQRPEARNAMNAALAGATCDALSVCQDAGAIVITGADPAFCAGLDLRSLGTDDMGDLPPFVASVATSTVPTIAAVNGPAVTGGFELALACDFIVASERAAFADTHLRVGVFPGPVLLDLPRRVGMAWAREMSLTGNFVDAETAGRIGIANHVVPHDELLPLARSLAHAIAEQDRGMVAAVRAAWDATTGLPITDAQRIHLEHAARSSSHHSGAEIAAHRDAVLARSRDQRTASP
ncbi:MAG TPA: enoyl-CoA hydratase [Acidimicrobiia bacterium]|nr:enoyl-CoA hydratase [Acidimicrobiia bacterium]